jgi:hypothetical protein
MAGLRRMDSQGEKTHRQLIDCIRSKDTDALIESVETGQVEVNFMDDVGQTLLNWASPLAPRRWLSSYAPKEQMSTRVSAAQVFIMLPALDALPSGVSYSGTVPTLT